MGEYATMSSQRGYEEYDSKVKNLEGIFYKVTAAGINTNEYQKKFHEIINEVENDKSISNFIKMAKSVKNGSNTFSNMHSSSIQLDYETYSLSPYIKKLDDLLKELEDEILPFYEIYLLSSKIDEQLSDVNIENMINIINQTKRLIDQMNTVNAHNDPSKNKLISKAYETVYSALLHEEMLDRQDILTYINHLNVSANKENIGRLLSNDLIKLDRNDLIDEDIRTIKTEGLGYDYLTSDFLKKVSKKVLGEGKNDFHERKQQAIDELSDKVMSLAKDKDRYISYLNNHTSHIKNLRIHRALLRSSIVGMALVPFISFGVGHAIGKKVSSGITEYKTMTRTVNPDTGEIIGDTKEIFDEKETTYVATVIVYSPWRKNPAGIGYVSNVTAYEYIAPENAEENYHATVEDLEGNVKEKYKYVENKDELEETDSMTDSVVLITETYQDKNDTRQSTKFIIPFSIAGVGISLVIEVLLILLNVLSVSEIRYKIKELDHEIKNNKLNIQEIKDKLLEMKEYTSNLQDEYNNVVKKYGNIGDQLIIPEIDTKWVKEFSKVKRKK